MSTSLYFIQNAVRRPGTVVTVGTFDGVHAGHRRIIAEMVTLAGSNPVAVVTFDPHPREILRPEPEPIGLLTTLQERAELLGALGVTDVIVVPFTRDFSLIDSETFLREFLVKRVGMEKYVIGYDHQFGKNREGSIETAQRLGPDLGYSCHVIQKQEIGEITVSSTQVRNALKKSGDVTLAASFLGRPYQLSGVVIHGQKRGRKLGFPTANIQPLHPEKIIPATGVYAVDVTVKHQHFRGMLNIGFKPTFESGRTVSIETNIFNFDGDLYGHTIDIRFLTRIRNEQKFDSLEALISQLQRDKEVAMSV